MSVLLYSVGGAALLGILLFSPSLGSVPPFESRDVANFLSFNADIANLLREMFAPQSIILYFFTSNRAA